MQTNTPDTANASLLELVECQHPELDHLQMQYCQHTGKPCGMIPFDTLRTLVATHGIERAAIILGYMQKSVAPEWMLQDEQALDNLLKKSPHEYAIFALGNLMQAGFTSRIQAHNASLACQLAHRDIMRVVAELTKRILARAKVMTLRFEVVKLPDYVQTFSSFDGLTRMQFALQALLEYCIKREKDENAIESQGYLNFKLQKRLKGLTQLEIDLEKEFNDFELFEGANAMIMRQADLHHITGKSYQLDKKATKDSRKPKFAGTTFKIDFSRPTASTSDAEVVEPRFAGLKFGSAAKAVTPPITEQELDALIALGEQEGDAE